VAALAVVNAWGDVLAEDGSVLAGVGAAGVIATLAEPPRVGENTTLVCVCTDAALEKRSCGIVARGASAGIARAVDPAFTPLDGDVVFCLASGGSPPLAPGLALTWSLTVLGTVAASVTAAAIRDALD
jgi:L-aminopeptidase/D-esterase-like protein